MAHGHRNRTGAVSVYPEGQIQPGGCWLTSLQRLNLESQKLTPRGGQKERLNVAVNICLLLYKERLNPDAHKLIQQFYFTKNVSISRPNNVLFYRTR